MSPIKCARTRTAELVKGFDCLRWAATLGEGVARGKGDNNCDEEDSCFHILQEQRVHAMSMNHVFTWRPGEDSEAAVLRSDKRERIALIVNKLSGR